MKVDDAGYTSPKLIFKRSPEPLLSYMVSHIDDLVECSEKRKSYQHLLLPKLDIFIKSVYQRCQLTPAVLVVGLIYLERLKKNLPREARGEYDTSYKLFIATIVIATKYIEDSVSNAMSIYNVVSPLYSPRQLNKMERSFLYIIKFDLHVDLREMRTFVEKHKEFLELELLIIS